MSEKETVNYKIDPKKMKKHGNKLGAFDEYQIAARVTANTGGNKRDRILNWALGISGEAGEVVDMIKKFIFHNHSLDKEELIKEIGDILWYLANMAYELDEWFGDVADLNIDKLAARYPEGFSEERSVNRIEYKEED